MTTMKQLQQSDAFLPHGNSPSPLHNLLCVWAGLFLFGRGVTIFPSSNNNAHYKLGRGPAITICTNCCLHEGCAAICNNHQTQISRMFTWFVKINSWLHCLCTICKNRCLLRLLQLLLQALYLMSGVCSITGHKKNEEKIPSQHTYLRQRQLLFPLPSSLIGSFSPVWSETATTCATTCLCLCRVC